jgi:predicted regulator of Ras-like GTPase activity (Roadblock/LC7/MglB family)
VAQSVVTTDEVAQLLDDLVDRVAAAEHAVALSPDGLLLAASRQVDSELADQISSVVAGLQALALAASRHCETGSVRQIIVQMAKAFLFIAATPGGAVIAVRFLGDAEVSGIAYEVALFAGKADRHLPTFPEPAQPEMTGG